MIIASTVTKLEAFGDDVVFFGTFFFVKNGDVRPSHFMDVHIKLL